jgi:predicted phage terminase large subunit-like protein
MFKRERFELNIRQEAPNELKEGLRGSQTVRYWDKAFTAGGGAYTVGVLMGKTKNDDYWILDVRRGQWGNEVDEEQHRQYHEALKRSEQPEKPMGFRDRQIVQTARKDKTTYPKNKVWLEHEPGSQGNDSCAVLIKLLKGFPVEDDPVKEDKTVRAMSYSSQHLAGNVYLLAGTWNEEFIAEHIAFPDGHFKDQVDASSGAFNKLVTAQPKMSNHIV